MFQDIKMELAFPLFMFQSLQYLDAPSACPNWEDLNMKSEKPSWNFSTVTSRHEKYHFYNFQLLE